MQARRVICESMQLRLLSETLQNGLAPSAEAPYKGCSNLWLLMLPASQFRLRFEGACASETRALRKRHMNQLSDPTRQASNALELKQTHEIQQPRSGKAGRFCFRPRA
jgi:hypothetical protein